MQTQSSIDIFSLQNEFASNELPGLLEEIRHKFPNSELLIKGNIGNKVAQRTLIFQQGQLAYCGDRAFTLDNFVNLLHKKIDTDWVDRIVESSNDSNESELTPKKFCERLLQMRMISKAALIKSLSASYLLSLEVFWDRAGELTINPRTTSHPPTTIEWPVLKAALEKRKTIWQSFSKLTKGFNSVPVITQAGLDALQQQFEANSSQAKQAKFIEQFVDGHSNIVELANRRGIDPLSLGQRIAHGIEIGWIEISDSINTQSTKRANILVIDDNPTTRKLLVTVLQEFYNAFPSPGTFSALGFIPTKNIDLVIVSHSVPVATGLHLCRIIRQNNDYQNMPIIFLSSEENFFDRLKSKMAGVTDYIKQPLDRTKIICTLDYHLR